MTSLPDPCPGCSTLAMALLVTDLGVVFQLTGGTCGAFFIFLAPGALLIQYAYAKHALAKGAPTNRLLQRAACGVGEHSGEALLRLDESYHYLTSKLFWAGVGTMLLGVGLCSITLYTILHPL